MLVQPRGKELLLAADDTNNTPIHTAIHHYNTYFLQAISGVPSLPSTVEKVRHTIEQGEKT
jgi:hypothetical protein